MRNDNGQTLLELVIVVAVSVIIVGALVFTTISSLRNASFSKNQAQATKLAQEGIEKVRNIRDRDSNITTSMNINKFSELYIAYLSNDNCNATNRFCYFYFSSGDTLTQGTEGYGQDIGNFKRQILLSDQQSTYQAIKIVTAVVKWNDFSGPHESRLTTILRRL